MTRLALLFALAAGPAAAQIDPADAFPLAVGNQWEFVDYEGLSVLTWEVTGEQTAGGERIALLELRSGASVSTCGVRTEERDGGAFVGFRLVDPDDPAAACQWATVTYPGFFGAGGFFASGAPATATATIGDTTVTRDAWGGSADDGTVSLGSSDYWTVLRGIGPVSFSRAFLGGHGIPAYTVHAYELTHAVVGGVEYGATALPTGDGPFERYLPLAVGDRWDYSLTTSTDGGADVPAGAVSLRVSAFSDEVPNERTALVQVVRQTADGTTSQSACYLRATAYSLRTEIRFTGSNCAEFGGTVFPATVPLTTEDGPTAVQIGGQTVTVDGARGTRSSTVSSGTSGITTTTQTAAAAAGIGVVRWTYSRVFQSNQPTREERTSGQLAYARVGGVEYGSAIVAGEGGPAATAAALTVGPNPARSRATVRFAPPAGPSRLTVVDALGREVRSVEVAAGAGEGALDVGGLAPGAYVVRLTAGAGAAVARLVVAR